MAGVNGSGNDLLDPRDASIRAEIDPVSALEGDEAIVVNRADPGWDIRRFGERHALISSGESPPTRVLLGPATATPERRTKREVVVDGWRFVVDVQPERLARLRERGTRGRATAAGGGRAELRAVIPGRVVALAVAVGDHVEAGATVLVIEAMKMQNEVHAPHAGEVERIDVAAGQAVEVGAVLAVIA